MKTYSVTAPDGTKLSKTTHDYIDHKFVVIGLMRLKKVTKKVKDHEDLDLQKYGPVFKAWILIGTTKTEKQAQELIATQAYRKSTDETMIIPCEGTEVVKPEASLVTPGSNVEVDELYTQVSLKTGISEDELREKYGHLNAGCLKMTLKNRLKK